MRPVISNAVTEVVVLNILSAGLQSTSADEVNSQRQSFFYRSVAKANWCRLWTVIVW